MEKINENLLKQYAEIKRKLQEFKELQSQRNQSLLQLMEPD